MGYYSDVMVSMKKKDYDEIEEKIEGDDFNMQILRLERRLIVDY